MQPEHWSPRSVLAIAPPLHHLDNRRDDNSRRTGNAAVVRFGLSNTTLDVFVIIAWQDLLDTVLHQPLFGNWTSPTSRGAGVAAEVGAHINSQLGLIHWD
jgi:hypothetical protein